MPKTVDDHLKDAHNKRRLILLSKSQLDENDCCQVLLRYGTITKIDLTDDRRAAFVDFACEHAPLLVARCFVLHKTNPKVPMPRNVDTLLPGCSIDNFLYVQEVPRAATIFEIRQALDLTCTNIAYRPGPPQERYSRAVFELKDKKAEFYTRNQMRVCKIKAKYADNHFYAIPTIPQLTDYSKVCDVLDCEECTVSFLRGCILADERKGVTESAASRAAQVPAPSQVVPNTGPRGFDFASIDEESEKERWGFIKRKEAPTPQPAPPPPPPERSRPSRSEESEKKETTPAELARWQRKLDRWFANPIADSSDESSPSCPSSPFPRPPSLLSLSVNPPSQLSIDNRQGSIDRSTGGYEKKEFKKEEPVVKPTAVRRPDLPPFGARRGQEEQKMQHQFAKMQEFSRSDLRRVDEEKTMGQQLTMNHFGRPAPPTFSAPRKVEEEKNMGQELARPATRGFRPVAFQVVNAVSEPSATASDAPSTAREAPEKEKRDSSSPCSRQWENGVVPRGFGSVAREASASASAARPTAREAPEKEKRSTPSPGVPISFSVARPFRSTASDASASASAARPTAREAPETEKRDTPSPSLKLFGSTGVPRGFGKAAGEPTQADKERRRSPSPGSLLFGSAVPRGFGKAAGEPSQIEKERRRSPSPSWKMFGGAGAPRGFAKAAVVAERARNESESERDTPTLSMIEWEDDRETAPSPAIVVEGLARIEEEGSGTESGGEGKREPAALCSEVRRVVKNDVVVEESARRFERSDDVVVEESVNATDVIGKEDSVEGSEDVVVEESDEKREDKPVNATDVIDKEYSACAVEGSEDAVDEGTKEEEGGEKEDRDSDDASSLLLSADEDDTQEELDSDDLLSGEEDPWRTVGRYHLRSRVLDECMREDAVERREERYDLAAGDVPSLAMKDAGSGVSGRREEGMGGTAPSPAVSLKNDDTISSRDVDGTREYDSVSEAGTVFDEGTVAAGRGGSDFEDQDTLRCSTPIVRVAGRWSGKEKGAEQRGRTYSLATTVSCHSRRPSAAEMEEEDGERPEDVNASSKPIRRWSRTSVVDQDEEDYRSSEYLAWLARDGGLERESLGGASSRSEAEIVPLPSSLPVSSWGRGIDLETKTTVPQGLPMTSPSFPVSTTRNLFGRVAPTFGGKNTKIDPSNKN